MGRKRFRQVHYPALSPEPGAWRLDWSRVDRGGPFPWPNGKSEEYAQLAAVLAGLNEVDLSEVFHLERLHSGESAVHAVVENTLSSEARQRWEELYARANESNAEEWEDDYHFITVSYCLKPESSERIICLFSGHDRRMYPLWWDPEHKVCGNDGRGNGRVRPNCDAAECFHLSSPMP